MSTGTLFVILAALAVVGVAVYLLAIKKKSPYELWVEARTALLLKWGRVAPLPKDKP